MKDILVVVDMQNDFIDGALGTKEAMAIVEPVVSRIRDFDGTVLFTRDTHFENYMDTQEGKQLPVPHCIKDTEGWQLNKSVAETLPTNAKGFDKLTFGSEELALYLQDLNQKEPISSITFIGLCTDICVISNALCTKAFLPEVPLFVDASCCAGVTPKSHENALAAMKMCQIHIQND